MESSSEALTTTWNLKFNLISKEGQNLFTFDLCVKCSLFFNVGPTGVNNYLLIDNMEIQ